MFPDNSDIDDKIVSELNTLVSFSKASLRLPSLAATTVLGVLAVSVSVLEVLPRSVRLSSNATTSCFSMLFSASPLSECLEDSPAVRFAVSSQIYSTTNTSLAPRVVRLLRLATLTCYVLGQL